MSNHNTMYPFFVPPDGLFEKSRETWSKKEADRFLEWTISVVDFRSRLLLAYFGIDESSGHEQTLLQLGERVYPLLSTPQFSHLEEHKPILPGMEP
jgi:hypothetical protein